MEEKENVTPIPSQKHYKDIRTGMGVDEIRQSILDNLQFHLAKVPHTATRNDWYMAVSYAIRDRMMEQWIKTLSNFTEDITVVAYLSAEFFMGPQLSNNLLNLGMYDEVFQAVKGLGLNLHDLFEQENEPGLGNSGVGLLAACHMDSLATLHLPAIGYGVRYEFGAFAQEIRDGWQIEKTDKWLRSGNPWEIPHPELTYTVNLGGHTESYYDEQDCFRVRWIPKFSINGTAYDTPVTGYGSPTINLLRLWQSSAVESLDFEAFNTGDYFSAVNEKIASESIGKILYPVDQPYAGKQLRLAQQYFFVSCALQDMVRLHLLRWKSIHSFSNSFAVHLHDTYSAIAVAELMRLLVDDHLVNWDKAWYITQNTFSCTNHSVLPEALEKWPVPLFADILPRHLEIIYEINRRFLEELWLTYPDNSDKLSRLSLIDENDQKYIRMSHLAALGSHGVNGVTHVHSELLKKAILPDIFDLYPERFFNVTSGVTQRRWLALSNPGLAELITDATGDRWISQLEELKRLEPFADDPVFIQKWKQVKHGNKCHLAGIIHDRAGIVINPGTLFDIQLKHIHEYKRQHLNILHAITLYNRIKKNPLMEMTPRTVIFGGKASPGYFTANLIIKLIHAVAETVNNDPDVAGRLNIVFFPDFNVKNGQRTYPAADLSEQISTAGRESSGTGNIKFSLNGALTIGSLNGANIEIREAVGTENIFLFGLTAEEIASMKSQGYNPMVYYDVNPSLKETIDLISSGFFSKKDINLFKPLIDSLLRRDEHMVLADYQSYSDCQDRISIAYTDQDKWAKMSVLTVARMGLFSSDRSVREYNEKIWHAAPLKIERGNE
jgi:glycogen phosphorylase